MRPWRSIGLWVGVLVVATGALIALRDHLETSHVALAYLLVVIGAGARAGRLAGLTLSVIAFASFDWFFVKPYGTFAVDKGFDWIVLAAFLLTGVVVTQLFERARRESDNARTSRAREAVVASVSHDLRTPLTTIRALAHDLAAGGDDRAQTIEEEADRLTTLVGDLLDYSRLDSGTLPLSIEANEAEDLLGAALQQVSGATRDRSVRVTLDPNEPLLFGRFDFTHTLRVLVNLLENALKYSPPSSAVDVSARRDGPWLVFAVADRGPGVPDDERERIFDPFYRRPGVAPDTPGVGLGLSIARSLAVRQRGSLDCSARPGGGSVFTLRLPAIDVADASLG